MVQLRIDMKGTDAAIQRLIKKKDLKPVQMVVKKHGALLKRKTIENMTNTYTAGYSTGEAGIRGTVDAVFSNGGMTVTVGPHKEYFPYLEYGTRFMSARPTLHPAFAYQSMMFINDLKKVLSE